MNMTDKLLVMETGEVITVADYYENFHKMKSAGETIGNAMENLEYSVKHGILGLIIESNNSIGH